MINFKLIAQHRHIGTFYIYLYIHIFKILKFDQILTREALIVHFTNPRKTKNSLIENRSNKTQKKHLQNSIGSSGFKIEC